MGRAINSQQSAFSERHSIHRGTTISPRRQSLWAFSVDQPFRVTAKREIDSDSDSRCDPDSVSLSLSDLAVGHLDGASLAAERQQKSRRFGTNLRISNSLFRIRQLTFGEFGGKEVLTNYSR
jgi:hypothetical protein